MKSKFPVYDICGISGRSGDEILVSRFAPYLEGHGNLRFPHKHTFYHLVFFTEGAGSHTIDFQNFTVHPGQIYFMVPGQVHSWSFTGEVDGYIINFSRTFFQQLLLKQDYFDELPFFSGQAARSVINMPDVTRVRVHELFEQIIAENDSLRLFKDDLAKVLILQVLLLVARLRTEDHPDANVPVNHALLRNFEKLIEKHYDTLKLPREYAALLQVTPNHLNAVCSNILGTSSGELIRNRVLLEAKRLLTNLDLTIAEIAYQLNFSDNSYFTKFFKKYERQTPEAFRRNLQTIHHENDRTY